MARASLSGFPELLPHQQIVEQHIKDSLRHTFELHGFTEIHTRAVEPVSSLVTQGETAKEIYVLSRIHDTDKDSEKKQLGLHFDLTVPLARYVVENSGQLTFPFKRYQIQEVWRGERPQEGRFREFTQADVDVVGDGELPFIYDIDVPLTLAAALAALPIPPVYMRVNNRKISQGFYEAVGISDLAGTLRILDKLEKIGAHRVTQELNHIGVNQEQAEACLALATLSGGVEVIDQVRGLGYSHPLLDEGLDELHALLTATERRLPGVLKADLAVARGLDYYTGTVFETLVEGHEDLGSICSGGRYESLATDGKRIYPGIGGSIGLTRLVSRIVSAELATSSRPVPTAVLVAVADEDRRSESDGVANELRGRGIPTDVAPVAAKFGKQIRFADRRGIPYVWFVNDDGHEVKDLRSGEQVSADPASWHPPAADLWPTIS